MHRTLNPPGWAPAKGYANGVVARGTTVFLGGQIGWNAQQLFETDDFVGQFEQTLVNILAVLKEAGAGPEHLVRMTWFITDKPAYTSRLKEIGAAYRRIIGRHYPAMSVVVVAALIEDRARIEIEATAMLPDAAG
ncbi:MAG TPA: RidA family protein [Beijerinckiaceae bacterium]|nr:RidA family protein [Beijerinckiaceae bacterium]